MVSTEGLGMLPGERSAVVARFRNVFRRALFIIGFEIVVAILGGILVVTLAATTGPGVLIALLAWFVLLAALAILWYLNWRCPVCGGYLGSGLWGMFSVKNCMNCGARLI